MSAAVDRPRAMAVAIAGQLAVGGALLVGVTLLSFVLMVHFGPDASFGLVGKNPTAETIDQLREQLGQNRNFWLRYGEYLRELMTLDLGYSDSTGERVASMLARSVPVTLALITPGLVLGNLLAIALALLAAWHRGGWIDRLITGFSVVGMSLSVVIVIIVCQLLFGVVLGWFPVRGWNVQDLGSYVHHVSVPTLATVFVSLGYNTRVFRAVVVEELGRDYVRTARAYGASPVRILFRHVLRNALIPIATRILFSLPLVVVSGSLLLETQFGIPGVGRLTFDAIASGDQPVLKAVVGLSAVLFVLVQVTADLAYRWIDPRLALR
ncbi:MAG: ABC transporter permease [Wenzhouxiangellaceae bacterium]|nr:ABC transporter permease [Wenzhouxiangellaceae bacterium]